MYSTRSSKYYCIAKLCLQHTTYALLIATDRKIISNIKIASDRLVDYSTITPFFFCPGACLNFKTKLKRVLFFYFLPFKTFLTWSVVSFKKQKREENPSGTLSLYFFLLKHSSSPHLFSPTWPHCPHTLPCIPFWTKATLFYNNFIIQLPTT